MIDKYIYITTDNEIKPLHIDSNNDVFRKTVMEKLDATTIDIVRSKIINDLRLVVDDLGIVKDKELNKIGTLLYGAPICGDIIVSYIGYRNGEIDLIGVPIPRFNELKPILDDMKHFAKYQWK